MTKKKLADVWAFGMILYTLFMYKEPFPGLDKIKIQNVNEDELSELFGEKKIGSKALKNLLMECCKLKPSERGSFRKIIEKEKVRFSEILRELDLTETLIVEIWDKASNEYKTKDIEFSKFHEYLIKYFSLEKKPEEAYYLKEALRLPFLLKLGVQDPKYMTRDNFGILARLFKFTKKNDVSFVTRIVEVFKADWFYGGVDRMESQKHLEHLTKNKPDGSTYFIIRYASSKQLCFTFQRDAKWENSVIETSTAISKDGGYSKYVEQFKTRVQLKHEPVTTLYKTFKSYGVSTPTKKT